MKVFYLSDFNNNLGDNLNKPILEWLGYKVEYTSIRKQRGKFVGIGSIMSCVRENDTVWGAGIIRYNQNLAPGIKAKYLAVRGKKTRAMLLKAGAKVPEVYGDPALLLPLMYNPKIKPIYEVGYIPHYVQKDTFKRSHPEAHAIDIQTMDWKSFVDQIKQCRKIISSSLHGLIIAEAYGILTEWRDWGGGVIGDGFKFIDYYSATDRDVKGLGKIPELKREDLKRIQDGLIEAISNNLSKEV